MKNVKFLFYVIITLFITVLFSCKEKVNNYLEEQKILDKYIADSNITTKPTYTGLYYIVTKVGTGAAATTGAEISVRFKGYFLDGTVFDQNLDSPGPFIFTLGYGEVIPGWEEGISYMKDGGKATLIVPSPLAYGAKGSDYGPVPIPPYTTLIFEVEVVNVQP